MEEMKNAIGNRLYARVNMKRILAKTTSEEEGWWVLEVEADVSDHCSVRSSVLERSTDSHTVYICPQYSPFPSFPPFSIFHRDRIMPLNYSKWDMLEVSRL